MKLKAILEEISRLPNGGVVNEIDRWDMGYLSALARTYRARLAMAVYGGNKRLHPAWYQKHWPEYDAVLNDDNCVVKFRHPEIIMLDNQSDGFRYIGATDCNNNFARIQSRAWVSTFRNNRVTNSSISRKASVLYDGSAQILEIYGDTEIDAILTESLLADPESIPTFNSDVDEYPIPENLIPDLVGMIFNDNIATEIRIPVGYNGPVNLPKQKKSK